MNRLNIRAILRDALALVIVIPFGGLVGGFLILLSTFLFFPEHRSLIWDSYYVQVTLFLAVGLASPAWLALPLLLVLARLYEKREASKIIYIAAGLITTALVILYNLIFEDSLYEDLSDPTWLKSLEGLSMLAGGGFAGWLFHRMQQANKGRLIPSDALALILILPLSGFIGGILIIATLMVRTGIEDGWGVVNFDDGIVSLIPLFSTLAACAAIIALPIFMRIARQFEKRSAPKREYVVAGIETAFAMLLILFFLVAAIDMANIAETIGYALMMLPAMFTAGALGGWLFYLLRRA